MSATVNVADSYGLASEHVLEQIAVQSKSAQPQPGSVVVVAGMEKCDCIPIRLDIDCGHWRLRSVHKSYQGSVMAVYELRS